MYIWIKIKTGKQAPPSHPPRLWYDTFKALLSKDECHFLKSFRDGTTIDLSIHVDDGLATSDNMEELNN